MRLPAVGARTGPAVMAAGGLLVIVLGSFLPWMRSGTASRDSYAAAGVLRRMGDQPGWLTDVMDAWPFSALLLAAALALGLLGLSRAAAALGAVLGLLSAAVAIIALAMSANAYVAPRALGPVITLTGALVLTSGSTLWLRTVRPTGAGASR